MEPPSGLATNICCLGNVASIPWISYTWRSQDKSQDDSSAGDKGVEQLFLADLAIRRTGGYSRFDQYQRRLWVFGIPLDRSRQNSLYTGLDSATTLADSFGLYEVNRGTLLSHGEDADPNDTNVNGKRERSDDAADILKANTIIASKNRHLDASLGHKRETAIIPRPGDPLRTDLLYAIQSSCVLELEKSHHFRALGNGLFCSTDYTEFDQNFVSPKISSASTSSTRAVWLLDIAWHDAGAILASYGQLVGQTVLAQPGDAASNVVLSPFGWSARTLSAPSPNSINQEPNQEPEEHRLGHGHTWRSQCSNLLRQYGLEAEDYSEWTDVEILPAASNNLPYSIQWPQQLCLAIADSSTQAPHANIPEKHKNKIWVDPFQEIAEWMNNTANREKLVKEQLSHRSGTSKVHLSKTAAEEEVLAHLQSRYEETLDAQAVAGIYPTPPDVNKSHGQMHTETIASLLNQTGEFYSETPVTDGASGDPQSIQDDNLDTDNYDHFKDDDLFDDMDTGMDGDNGVTEDDFRFFDEPDELDGLELTADPLVLLEEMVQESPVDISNNDQQASSENEKSLEVETSFEQEDDMVEATPLDIPQSVVGTPAILDVVTAEADHIEKPQSDIKTQGFDAKYSAFGKYAWGNIQRPSTTTPYTRIEQDKEIPLVRENILRSPSTTASPSSESFQEIDDAHVDGDDSGETDLSQDQGRLLNRLITGSQFFGTEENPDVLFKSSMKDLPPQAPRGTESPSQISIQLAQIVADQSIFYDLLMSEHYQMTGSQKSHATADLVGNMLQGVFPNSQALNLQQCTQLRADFSKIEESVTSFSVLSPPMMRVKRADTVLDISYPALGFWKELGIKPLHGPKDVVAVCLCQEGEMQRAGALSFLQSMEESYRSLNLGNHSSGHISLKSYPQGIVPVPDLSASFMNGKVQTAFCSQLGKSLSTLGTINGSIVVYIVKPSEDGVFLTNLCILFQRTFESYASMFRKADRPPDLVLQLIPPFMTASSMSRVFSSLKHCATVSRIIYDRCPTANSTSNVYASASTLQLAQPLPTSIEFRLTPDNSMNPMATHETFHLAYAYHKKSSWLSAALVDMYGSKQWSASYYLGEASMPHIFLSAVLSEIWEIIRLAAGYRRTYNVAIVKTGGWTGEEIFHWKNLARLPNIALDLLTYDVSCPIMPRDSDLTKDIDALESELVVVPPTPDVSSPDPSGGKADEPDSAARLVDIKNQAWWTASKEVMIMHDNFLAIRKSSNAGYFVYGNNQTIGFYVVESTHATELATIAETYQGLRILAQVRCVHQYLPWHIAVAEGAHSGLERYLSDCTIV